MSYASNLNALPSPINKIIKKGFTTVKTNSLVPRSAFSQGIVLFLAIFIFWFFPLDNAWTWEVDTHEELTELAIQKSVLDNGLNGYLENNLGLENGVDTTLGINNLPVADRNPKRIMIQGSNTEDDRTRFLRHFHEPIFNKGLLRFDSSIFWALRSIGSQNNAGNWSWSDARDYFFNALTSPTKSGRDDNWGKTFRALGQVMHLLQDAANPSHVRDDPHPFDDGLHDFMDQRSAGSYIGEGIFVPNSSLLEQPGSAGPNGEPFSNLFDTDDYSGFNSQITLGTNIGVTEYTNANFFSDDTIPGQGSIFSTVIPFPSVTELVPAPAPSPYFTLPRLGSPSFPGAQAAKLTGNQAAAQFVFTTTGLDLLGQLQLDDAVYDGQSLNLIPRAVGYSAEVLRYFFRGKLDVISEEFVVRGQNIGGELCNETPADDFGGLVVEFSIPAELEFLGKASLFYDDSEENRTLVAEHLILSPGGGEVSFGEDLLLGGIPNPVRWTVVLDGEAGPGEKESRTIVAKTSEAPWRIVCIF